MEDNKIIELYSNRDESGINETKLKYGKSIHYAAYQIVNNNQDADECENDTYMTAWNLIPPAVPEFLNGYLCKISRNHAMHKLRTHAKQNRRVERIQEELNNSLTTHDFDAQMIDSYIINTIINDFLRQLDSEKRTLFIGRYWAFESAASLAMRMNRSLPWVKTTLSRLRDKLGEQLRAEGLIE